MKLSKSRKLRWCAKCGQILKRKSPFMALGDKALCPKCAKAHDAEKLGPFQGEA